MAIISQKVIFGIEENISDEFAEELIEGDNVLCEEAISDMINKMHTWTMPPTRS